MADFETTQFMDGPLGLVIEIFYKQTVPGTKYHSFMFALTSFFRHQKDSGRQSIYKSENLFGLNCILKDDLSVLNRANFTFLSCSDKT